MILMTNAAGSETGAISVIKTGVVINEYTLDAMLFGYYVINIKKKINLTTHRYIYDFTKYRRNMLCIQICYHDFVREKYEQHWQSVQCYH